MWARVGVCMPQHASIGQRTTCFNQFPSFLCGSEFGSSGLAAGASIHRPIFLTHSGFVLNVPVKTKFNLKDKKKKFEISKPRLTRRGTAFPSFSLNYKEKLANNNWKYFRQESNLGLIFASRQTLLTPSLPADALRVIRRLCAAP